jgi:hypothetical protein
MRVDVLWGNYAFGALNSPFSAMNYAKNCNENCINCNEILLKCNEIPHFRKIMKRFKTSLNVERSKNQG